MALFPLGILSAAGAGGATYELIATSIVSGTATTQINFTSIPQDYTHLEVRLTARVSTGAADGTYLEYFLNPADTQSYNYHGLQKNGSVIQSYTIGPSNSNSYLERFPTNSETTGSFGASTISILDYKNTTKNKTMRILSGYHSSAHNRVGLYSNAWFNTNAVNHIRFQTPGGTPTFIAGSRFSLYGIRG